MQPVKKLLLLLPLLFLAPRSHAQSFVQSTFCSGFFSTSATCTFTNNVTAGHAYMLAFYTRNGSTGSFTIGITNNNSDTIVKATQKIDQVGTASWYSISLWYACNIVATPNAKPTFTATNTDSSGIWGMQANEFSGLATSPCFDVASNGISTTGGFSTPWGAASVTPTWSNDWIVGESLANISAGNITAVSPFSFFSNFTTYETVATRTVTGTATVTPTWECTSGGCTLTRSEDIAMALIMSGATQGGPTRHRLLMSQLLWLWDGSVPVALFKRRKDLFVVSDNCS